jgi:hypothetical protein
VPAYKRQRYQPRLPEEEERFNRALSQVRVRVEHTFGLLKSPFKSLEGLRVMLRTDTDESRSRIWVICAAILHNLLLDDTADDYWQGEDMERWERQWEQAAEKAREDRARWEEANNIDGFAAAGGGDQRTREYVRQFAESAHYGPAYIGGVRPQDLI